MDNLSKFKAQLKAAQTEGWLTEKVAHILLNFFCSYHEASTYSPTPFDSLEWFTTFLHLLKKQALDPYLFQPYHERVRTPFDYYEFGIDFLKPLVDLDNSRVEGRSHIYHLIEQLALGHNVIFFANHQIEADPQALSILLDDTYPGLAEKMIFVAGERVITDPLAIPFSLGRNLLCIYSKRYIDHPPEKKVEKQLHNKRTMELMSLLLREGGKSIYVAPSGGRDRRNSQGIVEIATFDPASIEMFYLMSQKSETPTHFYPMALVTYDILPPPETVQIELGEMRHTRRSPIHLFIGEEIDMQNYPGSDLVDKQARREARAHSIWSRVVSQYQYLIERI